MHLATLDETPSLRRYAAILSLLHTLTGLAWFTYKHIDTLTTGRAVCWPWFSDCASWRAHLSPPMVRDLVIVYMALGVVSGVLFLTRRRPALFVFVFTTLIGALLYALDYRLRFNQTYMLSWVVLVLLLAPRKPQVLQVLVASFYFWAGTLKLDHEWISGAALYAKPWLVPESLVPASCVYVLVLELVLVWGLFSTSTRVRWAVYAQLVLFHVTSFTVVGYFYPLLMFGLGAIFPLCWLSGEALTWKIDPPTRTAVIAMLAVFGVFQLVPHVFPGDTAVTGEGRLFALHMFDARVECSGGGTLVAGDGTEETIPLIAQGADARSRCDPLVLFETARWYCERLTKKQDPRRLDLAISARRATDPNDAPLIDVKDFCDAHLEYSSWHHNAWIR